MLMPGRILIAEDDPKQAELVRLYLERAGFAVVVSTNGHDALEQIRRRQPDLVVLDVMMPKIDGLDVCRILRHEQADVAILMLTARSTEDDLLLGLELGADDYMTKPFSPRELVARIRAVLRRNGRDDVPETHTVGGLRVDEATREVSIDGRMCECTPREFDILLALIRRPGRVFTRLQLLEQAFGFDYDGLERTVDVHVGNLRRKIEPNPVNPTYLTTVYGVGYRLSDPTSEATATAALAEDGAATAVSW
jgi:DNA-binding response OmpR family regulator